MYLYKSVQDKIEVLLHQFTFQNVFKCVVENKEIDVIISLKRLVTKEFCRA